MRSAAFALLMLAATLSACSRAPEGQAPPVGLTIVSLNPCSDAVLAEVADPGQVLALSHYSSDPSSSSMDVDVARRFPSVSGSVEEVMALKPDVVVTGTFVAPAMADAFHRLGVRLEKVPIATSVAESKAQVTQLAALAGHPERGAMLNRRIDAALAEAAPPATSEPASAVVWQSGGIVPGRNTLIADLLRRTGFASLSAARGMGQAELLPLEVMLADPPQVILAAGNPQADEDRMLGHPALRALAHTRHERFDPSLLWCGGPTLIRSAQRLAEIRRAIS